jgi:hypothetical protein
MQMPKIIALCGRRRSGKDTVAEWLAQTYGYRNVKVAARVKACARAMFDLSEAQTEGALKDAPDPRYGGATPRRMLQWLGTDVMQRAIADVLPADYDARCFQIDGLVQDIEAADLASGRAARFVVSDVRFEHELARLREYADGNMIAIRLVRPAATTAEADNHVSEREVDALAADLDIVNDGSRQRLFQRVAALFTYFQGRDPEPAAAPRRAGCCLWRPSVEDDAA